MLVMLINGRLATEEEQELICSSFVKSLFDSMTEQEIKDIADRYYEAIYSTTKPIRKDDKK